MRALVMLVAAAAAVSCSPAPAPEKRHLPLHIEPLRSSQSPGVTIKAPFPNSRIQSPLAAEGVAPNNWFFEGVFAAQLLAPDGRVIAEGPASAQSDWTVEGPVAFRVSLPFEIAADIRATLVLQEDMPREDKPPREVSIPVLLAAKPH